MPRVGFLRRMNLLKAMRERRRWSTKVAIHRIITEAMQRVFPKWFNGSGVFFSQVARQCCFEIFLKLQ